MIDNIQKTYRQPVRRTTVNKVQASAEPHSHNDSGKSSVATAAYIARPDRRQRRDRRRLQRGIRALYDMRSGRGRRKGDRGRKVELKI